MEKRIPVTNNTAMPIYVGSYTVPPGETRDFPESQVPPHLLPAEPAAEAPAPPPDVVAQLLGGGVRDITAVLADLPDDVLAQAEAAEAAGKARKTVIEAIAAEKLKRASVDPEMDTYAASLMEMGDEELLDQLGVAQENPAMLAAVENEIERRKG